MSVHRSRKLTSMIAAIGLLGAGQAVHAQGDIVPPPFEPLRVESDPGVEVSVWGRVYRFADGPLPEEIVSQGEPVFAAAPRFSVGDEPVQWSAVEVVSQSAREIVLSASGKAGDAALGARTRIEYDGMIHLRWWLEAASEAGGLEIESVGYEISLPEPLGELFHHHLPYEPARKNVRKLALPEVAGRLEQSRSLEFVPTLSLGNRRVGLEWWAETNAHWTRGPRRPIHIERRAGTIRLRVEPVRARLALEPGERWQDEIRLFPLPLRPPPPRWRATRFLAPNLADRLDDSVPNRLVFVAFGSAARARYHGLAATTDAPAQKRLRASLRKAGVEYIPYAKLHIAPSLHPRVIEMFPEWSANGEWWRSPPQSGERSTLERQQTDWAPGEPYTYAVCMGRRDYVDWLLSEQLAAFRQEETDGLYFDHGGITRMCSRSSVLDGHPQAQIFEYANVRHFYKRLYEEMKREDPDALIIAHSHGHPRAIAGFVDFLMVGESLNMVFAQKTRMGRGSYDPDYLSLPEDFLAAHLDPPVGGVTSVVPQISRASEDLAARRQRELMGLLLTEDGHAPLWNAAWKTGLSVWRALDRFGSLSGTEVRPWWDEDLGISASEGLRVASYRRDDHVLLVVFNPTEAEVAGRIRPDWRPRQARDLEEKEEVEIEEGVLRTRVPPRDFLLIEVRRGA